MLHARVVTKVVLNAQTISMRTTVRKPKASHGLIHHFLIPLKLKLQNHF